LYTKSSFIESVAGVWDDIYEFMCKKGTQEMVVSFQGVSLTAVEFDPGTVRVV
jgi:hypothetical protein